MNSAASSDRHTFDEFCETLAAALGITPDRLESRQSLAGGDLDLDEISFATMVLAIQTMNPYFYIPDQMSHTDMTIRDLYHYYEVMGEGHIEAYRSEP